MGTQDQSRRDFLRIFAALSSTAVMGQLLVACGDSGGGGVAYGPRPVPVYGVIAPPIGTTTITGLFYADFQAGPLVPLTPLANATGVPVGDGFVITFSANMQSNSLSLVFADSGNNAVQYTLSWPDARTVNIVPASPLHLNTTYTLVVVSGIDSVGKRIITTNNLATFTTATS